MRFYTNVQMVGDNFLVRGYEDGKHFATREKFYPTLFCILSIIFCIFCLSKAMSVIPVGFTYATYGALTITAVTLFGIFKYQQTPNIYGILGIGFIVVGVILLNTLGKLKS